MGLFERFPYTNFHELNATWIIEQIVELKTTIEQFVSINALKYADPIQWNITTQYEKNTIVIDPLTGTAYISVQPVPSGVAITNTDYWTVVFDLGSFVVRAAKNFTDKFEEETTLTATFPSNVNDWLIWGDVLYRVLSPIIAGDQYVVGSNIEHFTAEDVIGHIEDLNTTDKSNLVAAINDVIVMAFAVTGDLDDLNTTDKSNLVAAVNELYTEIQNIINSLYGKVTIIVDTLNDLLSEDASEDDIFMTRGFYAISDKGNATYIIKDTPDASDISYLMDNGRYAVLLTDGDPINVLKIGIKNDGSADISTIFNSVNADHALYFPVGSYRVDDTLIVQSSIYGVGKGQQWLNPTDYASVLVSNITGTNTDAVVKITGYNVVMRGFLVQCYSEETGVEIDGHNTHWLQDLWIYNCKAYGVHNLQTGTRAFYLINVACEMSYGLLNEAYFPNTIGFYIERGTDVKVVNCSIMGFCRGIEVNGMVFISDTHIWCGGDTSLPDWSNWNGTIGIRANAGSDIIATNLYLDACATPISNATGSTVDISNFFHYTDDTIYGLTGVTNNHRLNLNKKGLHINGGYVYTPGYMPGLIENIIDMTGVKISNPSQITNLTDSFFTSALPYMSFSDKKSCLVNHSGCTSGYFYEIARMPAFHSRAAVFEVKIEASRSLIHSQTNVVSIEHLESPIDIYYQDIGSFRVFYAQASGSNLVAKITEVSTDVPAIVDYDMLLTANRQPFTGFLVESTSANLTKVDSNLLYAPVTSTVGTISNEAFEEHLGIIQANFKLTFTSAAAAWDPLATLKTWARPSRDIFFVHEGIPFFITAATGVISANYSFNVGDTITFYQHYIG